MEYKPSMSMYCEKIPLKKSAEIPKASPPWNFTSWSIPSSKKVMTLRGETASHQPLKATLKNSL